MKIEIINHTKKSENLEMSANAENDMIPYTKFV